MKLIQEMWLIPEMRTLNDCVRACKSLRWNFPRLDVAIVFEMGKPRMVVDG